MQVLMQCMAVEKNVLKLIKSYGTWVMVI